MTYELVQGDQAPQIQAVIKRADDGSAIDFSGGSCAMKFRAKDTTATLFTLAAADVHAFIICSPRIKGLAKIHNVDAMLA